jgi:hypothetical protein
MADHTKENLLFTFILFYGIPSIIAFSIGVIDASFPNSHCNKPTTRIEYLFPAYGLGCWANSVPETK